MDTSWLQETASSGSLLLAVPLALLAGLVGFFSPCVIPLLPGYMSYVTGISGADLAAGEGERQRGRMLAGSVLFVLGFTAIFVFFGLATGAVGAWLVEYDRQIKIASGVVVILMGLAFIGLVPLMQREYRIHKVPGVGLASAPLLGIIFGFGWMPCTGPTLGAILSLGLTGGDAGRGGLLAGVYALGLGIPFLLLGLAYGRGMRALGWVRRHQVWVTRIGGAMLVLVGLMLVTGAWDEAVNWLQVHLISEWNVSL